MVVSRPLRLVDEVRVLHLGHEMGKPLGHIRGAAEHESVVQPIGSPEAVVHVESPGAIRAIARRRPCGHRCFGLRGAVGDIDLPADRDGGPRPVAVGRPLLQVGPVEVDELSVGGERRGVPGVAHPGGPPHRRIHLGPDPDRGMRLLDGQRGRLHAVELEEPALVGQGLAGPQRSDDLHRLLEPLGASGAVDAEGVELILAVADPHPHGHPPAGHRVHGGYLLGNGKGVVQG